MLKLISNICHSIIFNYLLILQYTVTLAWLAAFAAFYWTIFSPYDFLLEVEILFNTALYQGIHRPVWCIAMSWVVWACHNGYGGPVDTFLSMKLWRPIARLSYCMYLVQSQFITYDAAVSRTPFYFSRYHWVKVELIWIWKLIKQTIFRYPTLLPIQFLHF